jgi:hypothetical protein
MMKALLSLLLLLTVSFGASADEGKKLADLENDQVVALFSLAASKAQVTCLASAATSATLALKDLDPTVRALSGKNPIPGLDLKGLDVFVTGVPLPGNSMGEVVDLIKTYKATVKGMIGSETTRFYGCRGNLKKSFGFAAELVRRVTN